MRNSGFRYTGRQLTYPKDILPALSGIAQVFSQGLEDEYKAGLWNEDLPRRLLWTVADYQPTPLLPKISAHDQSLESLLDFLSDRDRCLNPSWSWSSRPKHTNYEILRSGYYGYFFLEAASLEARTVVEGMNPLGLLSKGELLITSGVKRIDSTFVQKKVHKYGTLETCWHVFLNDVSLTLYFDCVINNEILDVHEISLVLLGSYGVPFPEEKYRSLSIAQLEKKRSSYHNTRETWGLIICPCLNTSQRDVWFRIGSFHCDGRADVNGWEAFAGDAVVKAIVII